MRYGKDKANKRKGKGSNEENMGLKTPAKINAKAKNRDIFKDRAWRKQSVQSAK